MPMYLVEDMQKEEHVTDMEADNIEDAVAMLYDEFVISGYDHLSRSITNDHVGLVIIQLPYGRHYIFEVGEEGK